MRKLVKATCCLMLAAPTTATAGNLEAGAARLLNERVAQAATTELKETGVPSLQIAIGFDGRIVFEGAYGLADVENDVAATTRTRYRTASISKWMTAAAALRLAEHGKLDLDAPIQRYCPEFAEKRWTITSRHLLTHTSGVRHYADYDSELENAETDEQRADVERRRDRDRLGEYTRYTDVVSPLQNFGDDPLEFEPGTAWQYTSLGYRVLGCVIQGAAGQSYRETLREFVFDATGMADTLADDAWQIIPRRAQGYRMSGDEPLRRADMRDVSENLPAGGHLATATDLVTFALALRAGAIVSDTHRDLMSRPLTAPAEQAAEAPSWRDAIPSEDKYGYGVMFFPDDGRWWHGHTGRQAGASAIVMQAPDSDLTIAVMTNAKGWRGFISFSSVLRTIAEEALEDST